jgi:hypothetical protein
MISRLREAAFIAVLTVATPVWAHSSTSAEALNQQELVRLATQPPPPNAVIPDPVGLIVADGIRPSPPRFPGLLTAVGYGIAVGATALDTLLVGPPQ